MELGFPPHGAGVARGDADNDGSWNVDEWLGITPTGVLLDDIASYAEAALDPEAIPSASKARDGVSKQGNLTCPNANCIPEVTIGVYHPNTPPFMNYDLWLPNQNMVRARLIDSGGVIEPGTSAQVPIGTKIVVEAKEDTAGKYKFIGWSLPGTLIHGSRKKTETFYATESGTIMAGFARNEVVVPANNQYVTYNISGTLNVGPHPRNNGLVRHFVHPDQVATLSGSSTTFTRPMWVAQPTIGGAAPSHNRTNPSRVRSLPYGHISSVSPLEKQAVVHLLGSAGGELWGSANPANWGRFLDSITSGKGSLVRVDARANPGYDFVGFAQHGPSVFSGNGSTLFQGAATSYIVAGKNALVAGLFKEKSEYELRLKLMGDDVPCSGYVTATPAMKYYPLGTWVTLEATALPGYKFVEWAGDPETWHHGTWRYGPEITFTMDRNYSVKAVFKRGGIASSILSDDELLPTMPDASLNIPPKIQNETAVVTFVNPSPGEDVTARIVALGPAKGHVEHQGRHAESSRAPHLGQLTGYTESGSNDCEIHQWILTPSEFSGKYAVEATVGESSTLIPFTVKVPGLVSLSETEEIELYQSASIMEEIHIGHYHLTAEIRSIVEAIAEDFHSTYPSAKLYVNDCSLEWGGKFEYGGYWTGSHQAHFRGLEADINKVGSASQLAHIRDLIDDADGVFVHHHDSGHWHIRAN